MRLRDSCEASVEARRSDLCGLVSVGEVGSEAPELCGLFESAILALDLTSTPHYAISRCKAAGWT